MDVSGGRQKQKPIVKTHKKTLIMMQVSDGATCLSQTIIHVDEITKVGGRGGNNQCNII